MEDAPALRSVGFCLLNWAQRPRRPRFTFFETQSLRKITQQGPGTTRAMRTFLSTVDKHHHRIAIFVESIMRKASLIETLSLVFFCVLDLSTDMLGSFCSLKISDHQPGSQLGTKQAAAIRKACIYCVNFAAIEAEATPHTTVSLTAGQTSSQPH